MDVGSTADSAASTSFRMPGQLVGTGDREACMSAASDDVPVAQVLPEQVCVSFSSSSSAPGQRHDTRCAVGVTSDRQRSPRHQCATVPHGRPIRRATSAAVRPVAYRRRASSTSPFGCMAEWSRRPPTRIGEKCPRWDSNPHWTLFESAASAVGLRGLGPFGPARDQVTERAQHSPVPWSLLVRPVPQRRLPGGPAGFRRRRQHGDGCRGRRTEGPRRGGRGADPARPRRDAHRGGLRRRR